MAVAFLVTWLFDASVDAQGGAYATGVLVLITSASVAVTLSTRRRRQHLQTLGFGAVAAVFLYTTGANVVERPEGVRIGACFVAAILLVSLVSRSRRAFELRSSGVVLDATAQDYVLGAARCGTVWLVAHEPGAGDAREYRAKAAEARKDHGVPGWAPLLFLEVTVTDASDFESELLVRGEERSGYRVLTVRGPVIANTIAEILLHVRDTTGAVPHAYFSWTEGNPLRNLLRFLLIGDGEVAPVTREVLREAERDPARRPRVHVG
jgi:hypothetical protein